MQNFELELVNSFNSFFEKYKINAIAYRRKQSKYSDQFCDILVDSKNADFYLAIENKSINLNSSKKLYFSQHFHSNERKQIEKISEFLKKSGRKGFLALEVRKGKGRSKKAYLIDWNYVFSQIAGGKKGIDLENLKKIKGIIELKRKSGNYVIDNFNNFK